jgi:hypothetical protein
MSQPTGFARLPHAIYDALERGDINETQFIVLSLLHKWANYQTGRVDSFCAERVLRFRHIEPTQATLKALRRQIAALRQMGWFHDDYQKGSKRPYHVFVHNYVTYLGSVAVHDNVPENVHEAWPTGTVINPCEITPYQNVMDFNPDESVPDAVPENACRLSSNNQSGQVKIKDKTNPPLDLSISQADDLLAFIYDLTDFIRSKQWALSRVKQYSLDEIKYALVEWMFSNTHGGEPAVRNLGFFFKEGMDGVIYARRKREGSLDRPARTIPVKWPEAMAQLEARRSNGETPAGAAS